MGMKVARNVRHANSVVLLGEGAVENILRTRDGRGAGARSLKMLAWVVGDSNDAERLGVRELRGRARMLSRARVTPAQSHML